MIYIHFDSVHDWLRSTIDVGGSTIEFFLKDIDLSPVKWLFATAITRFFLPLSLCVCRVQQTPAREYHVKIL